MSDQQKPMTWMLHGSTVCPFLIATAIAAALLFLSAITFILTVIAPILAFPILVISSPITIPAGALLTLIIIGFSFSSCCFVAALAGLSFICKFVAGKHPLVADQFEYARMKTASEAEDIKEMAKEYGQYVQHKAQEAIQSKDLE